MTDYLGWIATAVFVSSYFFKRPAWLRACLQHFLNHVQRVRRDPDFKLLETLLEFTQALPTNSPILR